MSAQALDSFFVELFFKGDTKAAENFSKALDDVKSKATTIVGAVTAAAASVMGFVGAVAGNMAELHEFAQTNNLSASSIAAFGKVAKSLDVDMETLKGSMQGLNIITGEASRGFTRATMIFEKLGMSAKDSSGKVKSVDDMLYEVSDRIKDMPRPEQLAFLQKLRIDPRMVKVLEQGSDALRKMREEAEGYSPFKDEDYEKADKVVKLYGRVGASVGMLSKLLAVKLFPVVEKVLNTFLKWFAEQRKATDGVFIKAFNLLSDVLGNVWFWIVKLKDSLYATFEYLNKYKVLTYALITALTIYAGVVISQALTATGLFIAGLAKTAIEMAKNVTKVGLMTGAIRLLNIAIKGLLAGAIFLIIEDLASWYQGNESVLQQLSEKYPASVAFISTIITALGVTMWAFGTRTVAAWIMALGPIAWFAAAVVALGVVVYDFWDDVVVILAKVRDWGLSLGDDLIAILDSISSFLGEMLDEIVKWFESAFSGIWTGLEIGLYNFLGFIAGIGKQIAAIWDQYVMTPFKESIALIMKAKDLITGAFDGAKNLTSNAMNSISNTASSGWNQAKSFLGFGGDNKNGVLGNQSSTSAMTNNNNVNVSGVTVNVTTNNPAEMGNAVNDAIKNSLRNSQISVAY